MTVSWENGTALHRPTQEGELRLRFAADDRGETVLAERFRRGLYHFGKGYREERRLVLQVLNPTAGLFEGDRLEGRVTVAEGAHAALLAPSSTQVYGMPDGGWATSAQTFSVGDHASLVNLPRWSVLHRGARLRQSTRIELAPTASLFFLEQVSAGRQAHGEHLEFEQFCARLEIDRGGRPLLRERWSAGRTQRPWIWQASGVSAAYYATLYLVCPGGRFPFAAARDGLAQAGAPGLALGFEALEEDFYVARLLAQSAGEIQRWLRFVCAFLPTELTLPAVFHRIS